MSQIVIGSIVIGVFVFLAGLYVRGGLITLAYVMKDIARQIHVHAETLNEIKHQGIGIDEGMSPGEKFVHGKGVV